MKYLGNHWQAKVAAIFFGLFLALSPISTEFTPKRVEAQEGCSMSVILSAGLAALGIPLVAKLLSVPVDSTVLNFMEGYKILIECVISPFFWFLAKLAISKIIGSITDWVRSGFQGAPTFVTDIPGFMLSVADAAAGEFLLAQDGLSILRLLCSPIAIDIQIQLIMDYFTPRSEKELECSISDMFENAVDGYNQFVSGDFSAGGWQQWFSLNADPQNNYTGAYLNSRNELAFRIQSATGKWEFELPWNSGWLSMECTNDATGKKESCTPGSFIKEMVEDTYGSQMGSLVAADDINELIGALGEQLVMAVLQSSKGLFGFGEDPFMNDFRTQYGSGITSAGQCMNVLNTAKRVLTCAETDGTPADVAALEAAIATIGAVTPTVECTLNLNDANSQNILTTAQNTVNEIATRLDCGVNGGGGGVGDDDDTTFPDDPDGPAPVDA